jgi:uncharacterized protein YciI
MAAQLMGNPLGGTNTWRVPVSLTTLPVTSASAGQLAAHFLRTWRLVMFLNRSVEDHETNSYVLEEIRMYALAIVRYRLPIEEVDERFREAHRDYLRGLKEQGLLIASGPFKPHFGGAFLLRVPDTNAAETLDQIRDRDPFTTHKFAQYELLAWDVKTGIEDLDKI